MAGGAVFDGAAWLASLRDALTVSVADVEAVVRSLPGKADRRAFRAFVARMRPGDVLWHREGHDERRIQPRTGAGWCIVRDGVVIDGIAD
jgi:hypothetical protein